MKAWRILWLSGLLVLLTLLGGALSPSPAGGVIFQVTNLTYNSYNDFRPQIDNGQVVWSGNGGPGGTSEIYYYDLSWAPGTEPQNLSNNSYPDNDPQIDNGQVVWCNHYKEICYYDLSWAPGTEPQNISNNPYSDDLPQIDNGQVVWYGLDGGYDDEIFYYDLSWAPGTEPQKITSNSIYDLFPQIDNGQVVWAGYDGSDWDIYYYDLSNPTAKPQNISYNPIVVGYQDYAPQIDNREVVWEGSSGSGKGEIYYYDLSKHTKMFQKLSNNSHGDMDPQIDNGQVVWSGGPGGIHEIYLAKKSMKFVVIEYGFICYYGGDYYSGYFYDTQSYEIGDRILSFTDENGNPGYYEITGMNTAEDRGMAGQVFVDSSYYDYESRSYYPVYADSPAGTDSLGSEQGHILYRDTTLHRFGFSSQGSENVHYEADVTRAEAWAYRIRSQVLTSLRFSLYRWLGFWGCYQLPEDRWLSPWRRNRAPLFPDWLPRDRNGICGRSVTSPWFSSPPRLLAGSMGP